MPSTVFWYVSGEYSPGALVVRPELTAELAEAGASVAARGRWRPGSRNAGASTASC
ncbi:hypothetical protein [Amycolatopsis rubida]|uniref:hypothetical protein n=1 Tax=Amycolatopsis rubida TaxID=112413 RepID=UPI00142F2F6B|nr:hypothetical protein [Amycolatopsis rubida]